jgi:uncharacterized protein
MTHAVLQTAGRSRAQTHVGGLVRAGLPLYFVIAFVVSWLCWGLVAAADRALVKLPLPSDLLMLAGGLGPLIAAIVVVMLKGGSVGLRGLLAPMLRWRVNPIWYAVALLGWSALYGALVLLNTMLGGGVPPSPPASTWIALPRMFLMMALLRGGIDEEVGWRGLALPRLQARYGALTASVVIGLIWAAWHIPQWFISSSGQGEHPFYLFALSVVELSVILAWLYNNTRGSLLIVVLAHSANNVTFNVVAQALAAMPPDALKLSPLLTEVLLPIAVVAVLALVTDPRTLRRKEQGQAISHGALAEDGRA